MQLEATLLAAGMTPPRRIVTGRWMRFPGAGKGPSNRSGWCRLITPTLAIYGDWSTGLSEVWRDERHQDTVEARRLLKEAREREVEFLKTQRTRQAAVAHEAQLLLESSFLLHHPYLDRKGFPELLGCVRGEQLLVPMWDCLRYNQLINLQLISEDGTKRFMTGGRAKGAVHQIGAPRAQYFFLCEGYATGLSLDEALRLICPSHAVVVCFSAGNLEEVARHYARALVMADHDASGRGERAAKATGLQWSMPPWVGMDFNDWHQKEGIFAVCQALRGLLFPRTAGRSAAIN